MQNGASSTQNYQSNETLQTQVPSDLKTLIRIIMRNFYGFELYLCMEMLLIYPCIKEDDLAELLRLDLKLVHQHLVNLKSEKFLSEKSIMETSADGKQTKYSYFFINYKMIVNVIKYKLDQIRMKIEADEKQLTTRFLFKCVQCSKTYSDLDTKDIFLTMRCTHCGGDIDEDTSCQPKQSARNLLHKFNTQMKSVFELLSKVEHVRLAEFLLRPEASDMSEVLEKVNPGQSAHAAKSANGNGRAAGHKLDKWSGDKTRNTDLLNQTRITINFQSNSGSAPDTTAKKDLPSILLLNRTPENEANNRESQLLDSLKSAADQTMSRGMLQSDTTNLNLVNTGVSKPALNPALAAGQPQPTGNLEMIIWQKLLKHEKKQSESAPSLDSAASALTQTSITLARKRSNVGDEQKNEFKKRKLNNGGWLFIPKLGIRIFKFYLKI